MSAPGEEGAATAMFYRMSAERLRARCLLGGLALALSALVPYEVAFGHGIFVWSVLPELPPAAKIAALAPAMAGLWLLFLGLRTKHRAGLLIERPTSRAIAVLAAFVTVNAALWIGRQSAAWDMLPLPDSMTTRPAPFLAVFAFTAAGVVLRFHARARRAGSALLVASAAAALVFYLWPSRGEIPAQTIARAVVLVATLPDARFQLGYGMVLLFVLGPLAIALLGLAYVRRVPRREHPGLAIAAVWAMPALMLFFVYRVFLSGGWGVEAGMVAFFALLLAAVVAVLASAIEVLALGVTVPDAELESYGGTEAAGGAAGAGGAGGARPIVAGSAAAVTVAALLGAMFVLGRPAPKGVDWKLGAPTDGWDKVFGELLPSWERARLARDAHARGAQGTGAQAQVMTRAHGREMLAAARAQPNGGDFAAALAALAAQVDDLELSGRGFGRLVAEVNDAARRAALPYYLDASVFLGVSPEGPVRRFYTTPYRVKEVHGFRVGEDRFATLLVEPMTGDRRVHLGFSRDQDPFALVLGSEVRAYAERAGQEGATCLHGAASADGAHAGALLRCDGALAALRGRLGARLEQAVLSGTERHELQHQVDGPDLPLSSAVAELLAGFTDEAQDRANRELSAYLAEMTTRDAPPQLTLVHLFPFGLAARGGPERRVAVLALETLSGKKLRSGAREVDPEAYAAAFEEQVRRGDDELRDAARRAYRAHFGADLEEPVRE
ncbi:hypothetical protein SOCE26_035550 [Sorangium cellulosum]|uniref:Uncharacterized protein n=1 Tax=Sorangium cellulosum TaxID=56 RepID=A0A2L0ES30_SORCE|nr:hypothetical protein [Sorangium cellulosum]AUX42128.1 hypothetical protein SOCE26_035550 [Sorangium cellulosum]